MKAVPVVTRRVRSYDGTELCCYSAGDPDAIPMVLCNGLGGNRVIWRPLFDHFASRFRLLCWDYRGLFGSGPAPDPAAYSFAHHLRDLVFLIERERLQSPLLVGWSMGVQVCLELHRTHPDLARAVIAIHGNHGLPLKTAFDSSLAERIAPSIFTGMRFLRRRLAGVGPYLAYSRVVSGSFVWAAQRLGVMAPTLDMPSFRDLAAEWIQMDLGVYAEIFEHVAAHDASDLLPSIETPTLIIAGGADRFTPAHLARRLAEELPNAELHVVPNATHFGLLEYPDAIVGVIDEYLRKKLGIRVDGTSTPRPRRGKARRRSGDNRAVDRRGAS